MAAADTAQWITTLDAEEQAAITDEARLMVTPELDATIANLAGGQRTKKVLEMRVLYCRERWKRVPLMHRAWGRDVVYEVTRKLKRRA